MSYQQRFADIGTALDEEFARIAAELESTPVPPDPETEPEPEPLPPSSGLPAQVLSMWHHCWKGPLPWSGYPGDVRTKLNFMSLGVAQSGGAGTGKLSYYNRFGSSLKPAVLDALDEGRRTVMGIGGAKDGGITITNDTQVTEAFNSMVGFVDSIGITGLDIDLEPSGSGWNEQSIVKLADRLLNRYPNFIIGITPGLYGDHTARWMSLARALGDRYDYMAPMLYDFYQAGTSELTPVALQKCKWMKEGGVPESKMILGFMTMPHDGYKDPQGRPIASTLPITQAAYDACKRAYPQLRGVFHWEDAIDSSHNWVWTRGFKL